MNISTIIIIITIIISAIAFREVALFDKLKFNTFAIKHHNQWYRILTHGFIHADWAHLALNMFVLYSFGEIVLYFFKLIFEEKQVFFFILLYLGGLSFSTMYDLWKYGNHPSYNAVGASGAVSAVVFSSILLYPMGKISLIFIPIGIPSFIFGALYLAYSAYMDKKNTDNIGHGAHFWGGIFGFLFPIILKPSLFLNFIEQILSFFY